MAIIPRANQQKNPKPDNLVAQDNLLVADKLRQSVGKREQGPTAQQQSSNFSNWKALADQLGEPYNIERIPVKKLRQMRRHAMIAFALHYTKTPLVRADWRINAVDQNGPNAQVAAFVDAALRPVYARLLFQSLNMLDFGFQAVVKRFKFEVPPGTYKDENGNDQPIWSEGAVEPIVYKTFLALEPEKVEPSWDAKTGEFQGIKFEGATKTGGAAATGGGGAEKPDIDLAHALWFTNEKDSVFGSVFGYPRVAYAYQYWWSHRFRWALVDRYFERQAVPPIIARYPQGIYTDPVDNEQYDNQDLIMEAAAALRSGGIAAIPSDKIQSLDKTSSDYEWDLGYLTGGDLGNDWGRGFQELDVSMVRSIFLPEQAVMEGSGGTSSRNVAAEMGDIFLESQTNLMAEIDDHINRYVIPHIVILNFPEFQGRVEKVTTGFGTEDVAFMKQIIQLVGQANPADLGVDIPAALEQLGMPLLSAADQAAKKAEVAAQVAAASPAANPTPGSGDVGVATGLFGEDSGYFTPRPIIYLSDNEDFISALPDTRPFKDQQIKLSALGLRKLFESYYTNLYSDFYSTLSKQNNDSLYLADQPQDSTTFTTGEKVATAVGIGLTAIEAKRVAERIVSSWKIPAAILEATASATASFIKQIITRAAIRESVELGADPVKIDDADDRADTRAEFVMASTEQTVRGQLQQFLASQLENGTDITDIEDSFKEHFADFSKWQPSRVARAETQDAYNTATLVAGKKLGVNSVQISDASDGEDDQTDDDCIERNGKVVEIDDAIKNVTAEHPHCTLYFKLVPPGIELSVDRLDRPDPNNEHRLALYDDETGQIMLADELADDDAQAFVDQVVDRLRANAIRPE